VSRTPAIRGCSTRQAWAPARFVLIERKHLNTFTELGLAAPIARALAEENYANPTPIQSQAIPPVIQGRDLVGIAQTGTGKTAAFALPILNHLATHRGKLERKSARVLVLSPTRELSGQIVESFRTYGRHLRLSTTLAIGGVPMGKQVRALSNGVDILVATPGRLLDLVNSNAFRLDRIEIFVLDEADRMLDMGFIGDIRKIAAKLPQKRQTLFFSATMPQEIEHLVAQFLTDPVRVAVTPVAKTADKVEQRVILIEKSNKPALLAEVLGTEQIDRALVFTRTKHGADKVVKSLEKSGIASQAIHGNKSQNQRERALGEFRSGKVRVLIATDIAARGIDVDGVTHVVNFDLPNIPESYVHRIGRTARAGAEGIAISFCDHEERAYLRDIEKLVKMTIPSSDRRKNPQSPSRAAEAANSRPQEPGAGRKRRRGRRTRNPDAPRGDVREPRQGKPQPHAQQKPKNGGQNNGHRAAQPQRNHGSDGTMAGVAFFNRKSDRRGARQNARPAQ
jgi:ATP-dependent RNA helicase RhlE